MYNENNEGRNFSLLKGFIMRLILIIIFILLLIWFVPWPDMSGLAPLQEQIFSNNLEKMKEAGLLYFTEERLPANVGDKKTITLGEMLDMKLLLPFVDKNGNTCSNTESYISIEKVDDDEYNYKMKVNLKCSSEEDYIYVYLGCYAYCEGYICEKQEEETIVTPKPTSTPKPIKPTTKPTASPRPTPTITPRPTITPTTSPTPTPTTTPTTSPTPTPTTTPTTSPTPTPTTPPSVAYEYEYKKTIGATYSQWSAWKEYAYKKGTVEFGKTDVKEIEDLGKKLVKVGTRNPVYVTRNQLYLYDAVPYEVCTGYTYTVVNNIKYVVKKDWYATGETYKGLNPPSDTYEAKWVYKGIDWEQCTDCVNHPYVIYEKYARDVVKEESYSDLQASCTSKETKKIDVYVTGPKTTIVEPAKDIYGYVYFYRVRTRKLLTNTTVKYTWSTKNNQALIKDGWVATGEYRKK